RAGVAGHRAGARGAGTLRGTAGAGGHGVRDVLALRGRAVADPLRRGVPHVIGRLAFLVVALAPGASWACATCVASAYGDRTFNWAFIGLILMPFVVGFGIGGVFFARYHAPARRRVPSSPGRFRALPGLFRDAPGRLPAPGGARPSADQPAPHEETSL